LAVLGFADTARAERVLTEDLRLDVGGRDAELVDAIAGGADPDLALTSLARLPLDGELRHALRTDAALRDRLIAVLGASAGLGEHLVRHPDHWRVLAGPGLLSRPTAAELRAEMLAAAGVQAQADGAAPEAGGTAARAAVLGHQPVAGPRGSAGADEVTALRVGYRRRLLGLAAMDLTGAVQIEETAAELADLAAAALEAALAIAKSRLQQAAGACRIAVIAMGKCGGGELNYASDVDVIFVAAPAGDATEDTALRAATQLAGAMIQVCSQPAVEGPLFPVDPNLRP
jgi:[glutamine synthetase] adenylyltransferase / [glutamine synthetase]-adenylyl-L-tyrosine phosphorylase